MTLVRVLKSTGFEQAGQIVDWRGPTEEFVANGTIEILPVPGQEPVVAEPEATPAPEPQPEVQPEPVQPEVPPVTPEVVQEIADIKANIAQEEQAVEQLESQVTK